MAFDLTRWRQEVRGRLREVRTGMNQLGANSVYSYVALAALLPVLQAAQAGEGTVPALLGLAGGVGGNLLAEQLQSWQERANSPAAQRALAEEVVQRAAQDEAFRAALDALFVRLELQAQAQQAMSAETHARLLAALKAEYAQIQRGNVQLVLRGVNFPGEWSDHHPGACGGRQHLHQ